ncbi:hypothetical protein N431DRAFT_446312 [Stipitochalara longipes BDJ]|nr:hypothetical protein N431DRAFT_446312 [Stipitochalara longipes BDJ]
MLCVLVQHESRISRPRSSDSSSVCQIQDLVQEGDRAATRRRRVGTHRTMPPKHPELCQGQHARLEAKQSKAKRSKASDREGPRRSTIDRPAAILAAISESGMMVRGARKPKPPSFLTHLDPSITFGPPRCCCCSRARESSPRPLMRWRQVQEGNTVAPVVRPAGDAFLFRVLSLHPDGFRATGAAVHLVHRMKEGKCQPVDLLTRRAQGLASMVESTCEHIAVVQWFRPKPHGCGG